MIEDMMKLTIDQVFSRNKMRKGKGNQKTSNVNSPQKTVDKKSGTLNAKNHQSVLDKIIEEDIGIGIEEVNNNSQGELLSPTRIEKPN